MQTIWTKDDIEQILIQLNKQALPFKKYALTMKNGSIELIGKGSSANVYKAESREKHKEGYAIKVIGFGDRHVESESFQGAVEVQKDLGLFQDNVVKIYDSVELRVWIEGNNTVAKVEKLDPYEENKEATDNVLHLQFIVMEEITPIIEDNRFGKPMLNIHKLALCDDQEILKFAYDIGTAIHQAHSKRLIHRDIKLENIFYTAKGEHYKLGDFGIARTTDDGLASTVAFTKGYGAPEVVGTLDDKYDYTADIYSFGMVLYVLLNQLRFPGSKNYHPNIMQYVRGFEAEYPTNGSDELCDIVLKMISFDPDDRYQSMEDVLNEFDRLKFGRRVKYQREHKKTSLVMGASLAALGTVALEISSMPRIIDDFSFWVYLFWGLCVWKGIAKLRNKDFTWVSLGILGIGIYVTFSSGFMWWKLIGIVFLSFILDFTTGIVGSCVMIMKLTNIIMTVSEIGMLPEYRWISILLISLSAFLLFYYYLLGERDELIVKMYLGKNLYWVVIAVFYVSLITVDITVNNTTSLAYDMYKKMLGIERIATISELNLINIGTFGVAFCVIWIVRELGLIFIEKQIEKRKMY